MNTGSGMQTTTACMELYDSELVVLNNLQLKVFHLMELSSRSPRRLLHVCIALQRSALQHSA